MIGLNLCPFAKAVHQGAGASVSRAAAARWSRGCWPSWSRTDRPAGNGPTAVARYHVADRAGVLHDFLDFQRFLADADGDCWPAWRLDASCRLRISTRSFQFAGTTADDDITNATNRSPYPTLHLICAKRASIARWNAFPRGRVDFPKSTSRRWSGLGPEAGARSRCRRRCCSRGPGAPGLAHRSNPRPVAMLPARGSLAAELRPGQSIELLKRAAHPDARRQAQPGFAAQAQAGRTTWCSSSRNCCRTCRKTATITGHHAGRPRRGQVVPRLHHLRPVLQGRSARGDFWHRNPARTGAALARTGAASGLRAYAISESQRRAVRRV